MKLKLLKREILNFINDIVFDERKMKKNYIFFLFTKLITLFIKMKFIYRLHVPLK